MDIYYRDSLHIPISFYSTIHPVSIGIVFWLILLSVFSSASHANEWRMRPNGWGGGAENYIAVGATAEEACRNATSNRPEWCPGRVTEPSNGRLYCDFYYVPAGYVCTPCTGFNCTHNVADLWKTGCTPPEKLHPLTGRCYTPDSCDSSDAPVVIATGSKSISETDYAASGNSILEFSRRWESQYGRQWQFSYRQRLENSVDENPSFFYRHHIRIFHTSGRISSFLEENGVWISEENVKDTLTSDGANWLYTMSSGGKEWYNNTGQLLRILNVDGQGVNLTYPTTTSVVVTDDYGNDLTLTLDSSARVIAMGDPSGAVFKYSYNSAGNLRAVGYPDDTQGVFGSNPFNEDNPFRQYYYDDVQNDPDLVTRIRDENGAIHKTISYDTKGRATLSGLSNGSIGQTSNVPTFGPSG